MPTVNITDRWLRSARCKARSERLQTDYWDTNAPAGFGVRVSPLTGVKTFVVRYRANGRRRCYKIGTYPAVNLADARNEAKDLLDRVRRGEDPSQERREARKAPPPMTVGEYLDHYLERYSKPRKRSWREDARRIERIKAKLGSRLLAELTTPDVAQLHSKIGKTAPIEANRVVEVLRAALNKAREWGHVPETHPNAAEKVKRFSEQSRERFLTRDELPRVLDALGKEESAYVRGVFILILLTGLRKGEALALRWEHVDLDNRLLRIPETKAGGGRSVPLTDAAVRLLEGLPREKSPFVFPGRLNGGHLSVSSVNRAWRRVRKAAKVPDVTIHDLRRSVGSWLAMQGVGLPIIGAVLGHASPTATAIYARLQPDAGRQALDRYSAMLTGLVDDEEKIVGRIG
jgi:integrase